MFVVYFCRRIISTTPTLPVSPWQRLRQPVGCHGDKHANNVYGQYKGHAPISAGVKATDDS